MPPTDQSMNSDNEFAAFDAITQELAGVADSFGADIDRLSKEIDVEYKAAEEELGKLVQHLEDETATM